MSILRLSFLLLLLCLPTLRASRPWFILFGSEECDECVEIKEMWQEREADGETPLLIFINIDQKDNYAFLKRLERTLQITRPGNAFPILMLGNRFVAGVNGLLEMSAILMSCWNKHRTCPNWLRCENWPQARQRA